MARRVEALAVETANAPPARPLAAAMLGLQAAVPKRKVTLNVLSPREWFGANNDATDFDPERIHRAMDHGKAVAANRAKWLWP